jgi:two-component system, NtrC family, response regulator AtoC
MANMLIIDDEPAILESLEMFLTEKGHTIHKAGDGRTGLALYQHHHPTIVILDIRLPDMSGFDILESLNKEPAPPKIIMITAYHDMESAIRAMKHGAFDYIHKPIDIDQLEYTLARVLEVAAVETHPDCLSAPRDALKRDVIIGSSPQMLKIYKTIGVLCQTRANVLIQGETGTGKELIARAIHHNGPFCNEPFMTMDCSATVDTLIESELFGHEKGAFTGATHSRKGMIELAGSGTLFLDEIGELPMSLQGKMLGFLERREYMRVGGQTPLRSRCRIIAATNLNLAEMTRNGLFRRDLYYRLKVVTIFVAPLRERIGDVPALARFFLDKVNKDLKTGSAAFQSGVIEWFMNYDWPGNVRELENTILALAVQARGNVILTQDIESILSSGPNLNEDLQQTRTDLCDLERSHILDVLEKVGWVRTKAARILGVSLPTLRSKIRKYGISSPEDHSG